MSGFEQNEISKNSNGGTELCVRSIQAMLPPDLLSDFQIIPSRIRDLDESKIRVLWLHDLAEDPEVATLKDQSGRDKFHKIIFNSNWQMNEFTTKLRIPYDEKLIVIENAIEPLPTVQKDFSDRVEIVYFSTPQRGLEILIPVFDKLLETHPNIHLTVCSSFKIYGWDEKDKQYESIYNRIRNHPNMTYHGYLKHNDLRDLISKAHILAYPSIWRETSCRVLIESMSSGLLCVHPNLAALSDTSGGLTIQYQYVDDVNKHAATFYGAMDSALRSVANPDIQSYLAFVKMYADNRFNIQKSASIWNNVLLGLKNKYPTKESRVFTTTSLIFRYST